MDTDDGLHLRFWGVRGSIPTPASENLGYGGNTTCVEVRCAGGIVVIDGGAGARNLGMALQKEFAGAPCSLSFLMTHFHWDHIQGLPFFAPLYSPSNEITFYSSRAPEDLRNVLEGQMSNPYFPVSFELLAAKRKFMGSSEPFRQGALTIHSFPLNHRRARMDTASRAAAMSWSMPAISSTATRGSIESCATTRRTRPS